MMVIQVNNKALNQMKSCWILILSQYLYLLKDKGLIVVKLFFSILILRNVKISLPSFICDNKFLCFTLFQVFQSNW